MGKRLVRVVEVVLLRIAFGHGSKKQYLVEVSQKYPDGRVRTDTNQMPGGKKSPHENAKQTTERLINSLLGDLGSHVAFAFLDAEHYERGEDSRSYPGIPTVYKKDISVLSDGI